MNSPKRRSLLLAGGGIKVAFQAGVLQVWLSEARGLTFDHYDACSGGAFNLALLCNGRTGIQIADQWRRMRPRDGVSFSLGGLLRGESLVTMDGYRDKVFPSWGLDWEVINSSPLNATFTVYNRTSGRREIFTRGELDEDKLVATLSQAVWFPPVEIGGQLYTDAVFDADANVDAAIHSGADEIWVIWTVSRLPEWMPGILAQFFHVLEESANGTLESDLERIRLNNENPEAHFGRPIDVKVLYAEVPMHYLALFNGDRLHRGVEQGVRAARAWCERNEIEYEAIDRSRFYDSQVRLEFSDHLAGRLGGRKAKADLRLIVDDAGEFVNAGVQRVTVYGTVTCSLLDGMASVEDGYARILFDAERDVEVAADRRVVEEDDGVDPTRKRMVYVLHLRTPDTGRALTFIGTKNITRRSVRGAVRDAMTMSCRIVEGWVEPEDDAELVMTGLIWMDLGNVATQLVGARARGPNLKAELGGLARYGALFAGSLWDVGARKWLTYAPF